MGCRAALGAVVASTRHRHGARSEASRPESDPPQHDVVGERLVYELNDQSCLPLELVVPPRQGLTVSRSFGQT